MGACVQRGSKDSGGAVWRLGARAPFANELEPWDWTLAPALLRAHRTRGQGQTQREVIYDPRPAIPGTLPGRTKYPFPSFPAHARAAQHNWFSEEPEAESWTP